MNEYKFKTILISFPDLLWTKPKARSGKVRKFVFFLFTAPFDSCPIPSLKIYEIFHAKLALTQVLTWKFPWLVKKKSR